MGEESFQWGAFGWNEDDRFRLDLPRGGARHARVTEVNRVETTSEQGDSSFRHKQLTIKLCVFFCSTETATDKKITDHNIKIEDTGTLRKSSWFLVLSMFGRHLNISLTVLYGDMSTVTASSLEQA